MPKQAKFTDPNQTTTMAVGLREFYRFRVHASATRITLLDIVSQMEYLTHLRVKVARSGAEIDPTMLGSELELFTLLNLHDCGLLSDEEFARALVVAHTMPDSLVAERLAALRQLAAERIALLEPHWAQRRAQMASEKQQWMAEHASERPAYLVIPATEAVSNAEPVETTA